MCERPIFPMIIFYNKLGFTTSRKQIIQLCVSEINIGYFQDCLTNFAND